MLTATDLDTATAAYNAARDAAKRNPTPENQAAVKSAWDERERIAVMVLPLRKVAGYASRAGQRQAAERRAETQAALSRRRC